MSVYNNNQDIKPVLPALAPATGTSQDQSMFPLPFQPGKLTQNIVYPTNGSTYVPVGNSYSNPTLLPLHFYSTKNYVIDNQNGYKGVMNYPSVSPIPAHASSQYDVNALHNGLNNGSYNTSPYGYQENLAFQNMYREEPDHAHDEKYAIDYSSIINYTNSPSLKRKRKLGNSQYVEQQPTGELPKLPCSVCGKVFNKPYNLKSHMRSHSTEKPFDCSVCGKKFARSHDKKRHELLHKGEKNFKCEGVLKDGKTKWGCGKKFARSDALSRHFRTETGWLCIKPLMDEAKHTESHDLINNILKN